MKRYIVFLLIVCTAIMNAAGLDFGINISNNTGVGGSRKTVDVSQSDAAHVFLKIPTGSFSSVYLSGEARFYGYFPCKPRSKPLFLPAAQSFKIDRADWTGYTAVNGIGVRWALGRTYFTEYSKKILHGLFDGGIVGFTFNHADIAFALGYTGLTYKTDAKIRIDSDDAERIRAKNTILAPQRLFLSFSSAFTELLLSHTFGFDILTQFDLLRRKTATHTQYIVPYIHGRLHRNVSWKFWGAVQLGQNPSFFYSLASGLSLQYFNPQLLNLTVRGALDWAAGDYDGAGAMRAFIPVTDLKHLSVADIRFRNTLTAGFSMNIRPIQGLVTGLSYNLVTMPNIYKKPAYTGSELLGKISYAFYNDFDISFWGGIFIPNKNPQSQQSLRWQTELAFTLKL